MQPVARNAGQQPARRSAANPPRAARPAGRLRGMVTVTPISASTTPRVRTFADRLRWATPPPPTSLPTCAPCSPSSPGSGWSSPPHQPEESRRAGRHARLDWSRGSPPSTWTNTSTCGRGASAAFRRWLDDASSGSGVTPDQVRLIPGEHRPGRPADCLEYEDRLARRPARPRLLGIGVNGHLAFNDPPVADFADPLDVKVVQLDEVCREQQVQDGASTTSTRSPPGDHPHRAPAPRRRGGCSAWCPARARARRSGGRCSIRSTPPARPPRCVPTPTAPSISTGSPPGSYRPRWAMPAYGC